MFSFMYIHLSASQPQRRGYPQQLLNDLTQLNRAPLTNKVQMKHHYQGSDVLEPWDSTLVY